MKLQHIKQDEFNQEVLNSTTPVVVDFYADWCGPCQMLGPVLEEIAEEYQNIKIVKVNVDDAQELCREYGIFSIPHVIVFKDGKKIDNFVGFQSKEKVLDVLKKYM